MYVSSYAVFGDSEDILRKKVVKPSRDDTISFAMETRRKFVPGKYLMKKLREEHRIDTIIYHSKVDPDKIKNLLFHCDVGGNLKERNYLNRYDWLHARNWKGESMCFFVPEENIHSFIEAERPNSHGFCINLDWEMLEGDWVYGCLAEDMDTKRCFALVVQEMYTNIVLGGYDDMAPPLLPELEGMPRTDLRLDVNRLRASAAHV